MQDTHTSHMASRTNSRVSSDTPVLWMLLLRSSRSSTCSGPWRITTRTRSGYGSCGPHQVSAAQSFRPPGVPRTAEFLVGSAASVARECTGDGATGSGETSRDCSDGTRGSGDSDSLGLGDGARACSGDVSASMAARPGKRLRTREDFCCFSRRIGTGADLGRATPVGSSACGVPRPGRA